MIKLAPSVLAADFANLKDEIKKIESGGAEYIHIDVMDGHFVPNLSFGPNIVSDIRKITDLVLDTHLMIENPDKYVDAFLKAGSDIITIHLECKMDYEYVKNAVKNAGKKLGMSIKPGTEIEKIKSYLNDLDMVLIMSVEPGFCDQKFMPDMLKKAQYIRNIMPDIDIQMDGGINLTNVKDVVNSGVNVVVAGSSVFGSQNIKKTVKEFKKY